MAQGRIGGQGNDFVFTLVCISRLFDLQIKIGSTEFDVLSRATRCIATCVDTEIAEIVSTHLFLWMNHVYSYPFLTLALAPVRLFLPTAKRTAQDAPILSPRGPQRPLRSLLRTMAPAIHGRWHHQYRGRGASFEDGRAQEEAESQGWRGVRGEDVIGGGLRGRNADNMWRA